MRIYALALFFALLFITGPAASQGLGFKATQQTQISDRTSYVVFPDEELKFRDQLSLSFDLSVLDPGSFGFICVIDAEKSDKDYAFAYVRGDAKTSYLKLNLTGEENLLTVPIPVLLFGKGKWIGVKLDFNLKQDLIEVAVNGLKYHIRGSGLNEQINPVVCFGKHNNIIDVPSFAIRNLEVSNSRKTLRFLFREYTGNSVHDQDGKVVGRVENPVWLINDSYHWKRRFSYAVDDIVAVNYDSLARKILVAGKDSLVLFDMVRNTTEKRPYLNTLEVPVRLQTSFFDNGKLFVYEVNDVPRGRPTIASLDLATCKWENRSFLILRQQLHHHNASLDEDNRKLLIFGGFGNKRLSNTFYYYDILHDSWDTISFSGDEVTPRFFAGLGKSDGQLLLFGGVGNKTGDQSLGKIYYNDCYSIDLKSRFITKLWESGRGNEQLVSTRDLIISEDKASFYTLRYPEYIPETHIRLYKYDIKTGKHFVLGDSIPILSEEIQTNANLYLNSGTRELYCVVQEVRRGKTKINVYSIDEPPISAEELYEAPRHPMSFSFFLLGGFGIAAFCFAGFVFLKKSRHSGKGVPAPEKSNPPGMLQLNKNSVFIFGLFTVYNRNGQDCSHLFSPLMKQLFLIFLLRKSKEKGITSEEIYSILWPNKPQKNAKNLKGVSIHKLRTILSDIDGIELILEKQYFRLQINEAFYCDYLDLKSMTGLAKGEPRERMCNDRIIEILSRGQFLQSEDHAYFDDGKRELADHLLLLVPGILKDYYSQGEFSKIIKTGFALYCLDELNEHAFYYILNSYMRLNDEFSAKKHYNHYIVRYKNLQGKDFDLLYPEAIRRAEKYVKRG